MQQIVTPYDDDALDPFAKPRKRQFCRGKLCDVTGAERLTDYSSLALRFGTGLRELAQSVVRVSCCLPSHCSGPDTTIYQRSRKAAAEAAAATEASATTEANVGAPTAAGAGATNHNVSELE